LTKTLAERVAFHGGQTPSTVKCWAGEETGTETGNYHQTNSFGRKFCLYIVCDFSCLFVVTDLHRV